jgi:hypothetical protein
MTAHTTIQSSKTVETVFDWKQAVSAGIFDGLVRLFRSLETLAVSQACFSFPVSASKNSVPGGGISTDPYRSVSGKLEF